MVRKYYVLKRSSGEYTVCDEECIEDFFETEDVVVNEDEAKQYLKEHEILVFEGDAHFDPESDPELMKIIRKFVPENELGNLRFPVISDTMIAIVFEYDDVRVFER